MKTFTRTLLCALAFAATTANATDKLNLTSPNGQMQMTFTLTAQGEPVYDLSYKGKTVSASLSIGKAQPVMVSGKASLNKNKISLNAFTAAIYKTK